MKQEVAPGKETSLSVIEQAVLQVVGKGKFSAREIFAGIKKLRGEFLPPFLTIVDVTKVLSLLESEGFLQREEVFTLTNEAKSDPLKLREQRQATINPQSTQIIPERNDSQDNHVSQKTKRTRIRQPVKVGNKQIIEGKSSEGVADKLIESSINDTVESMSKAEKEGLFLFREGDDDISLLLDRRIMVRSRGKVKEILEAPDAIRKFGYVRLSASLSSARNRM